MLVDCGLQICGVLKYLHSNSIIHRSIKPSNIFVEKQGDTIQLVLGDLGLRSKFSQQSLKKMPVGDFDYVAPEVMNVNHQYTGNLEFKNSLMFV